MLRFIRGCVPGELDALAWEQIDFQAETILVDRQWNAKVRKFTRPKHGVTRTIALTDPARRRLLSLPQESEFAFPTLRGTHYTPSARSPHWNRVRCTAGLGNVDLYMASRHYFGWYAWNVLDLDARDIALHFGHQDGGRTSPQDLRAPGRGSRPASVSGRRSGRHRPRPPYELAT